MLVFLCLSILLPSYAASTPLDPRQASCTCGYRLTSYNNTYFTTLLSADFRTTTTLPSSLIVNTGWQTGSVAPDGTFAVGDTSNVVLTGSELQLIVPGGQRTKSNGGSGTIRAAELEGPEVIRGVFNAVMKLDSTHGTCQSMFTYHTNDADGDEQDIEALGSYLYQPGDNGTPAGLELTNWDPSGVSGNDNTIVPFPSDPAAAFHKYTLAWLPTGTKYYFDDALLNSPTRFTSIHGSVIILNHWSNGDPGFTQGPPTTTTTLHIQSIEWYYSSPGATGLPSGCTDSQVCVV